MKSRIENPYTTAELKDMFQKQLNKVPFKITKETKDGKEKVTLSIKGKATKYLDIWHDDYVLLFDKEYKTSGSGSGKNRSKTFEDFKKLVFDWFGLEEAETQLTFFE